MSMRTSSSLVELDFFGMEPAAAPPSPNKENTSASSSSSSKSQFQKLLEQQRTVRGMQSAISKLSPQLLKNVINSGAAVTTLPENSSFIKHESVFAVNNGAGAGLENRFSVPSAPNQNQHHHHQHNFASTLPVFINHNIPTTRCSSSSYERINAHNTAPLTIFYNGTVSVFDVPRNKAEIIVKLAENGINSNRTVIEPSTDLKVAAMCSSSMDEDKLLESLNGDDLPFARKKSLQRFLAKRKERMTTACPYNRDEKVK